VSRSSLSFWLSHQNPICIILLHACYMPCPSHPPWLDHSNYVKENIVVVVVVVVVTTTTIKGGDENGGEIRGCRIGCLSKSMW
jgi:hypothetical protein